MFGGAFAGRRVLLTGHTGFKGGWLAQWLLSLGARVSGAALAPEADRPNLFDLLGLAGKLDHHLVDVRDRHALADLVSACRPEVIFHLAAQPLVRRSYAEPHLTWDTNLMGTVNLLEAVRSTPGIRACVVVTTDKCYENREQIWGYREDDPLGGHDPYAASKAAAELAVSSYRRSFLAGPTGCRLASARAGNVIGGGDWSADRLVTDCVAAILTGRPLRLRRPQATRPWQHVLEPLSGYLHLAARLLAADGAGWAEAWNFGPAAEGLETVGSLARRLVEAWGTGEVVECPDPDAPHEAGLLHLDPSKARYRLGWHGIWKVSQAAEATMHWYRAWQQGQDLVALTVAQTAAYAAQAAQAGLAWARD